MEATNSSPAARIIPVIIIVIGLVALYYLYQYLFGSKSTNAYTLISNTQSAIVEPSKPIIISSDKLPNIYEGGEFTISTWIYVNNWSYRQGFNKSIINIGGPNFDTIRVYLGGVKPAISVRLQTRDVSGVNNMVPTGASASPSSTVGSGTMNPNASPLNSPSQAPIESLAKGTQNATFNILQTDSGLLDSTPLCDLPEIDLQKWVNVTVAVNGKTVDVYYDGKLARSCVLPSLFKVDTGGYSAYLLAYGGFGGELSTTTMYDTALNPEQVYKNYMAGPQPITNFVSWIWSFFTPGVKISVSS